ncbi:hypothetical protein DPEC_G00233750 [Dallia pectoralis]|uniref:Uncharacterized protein n=1 Tax=Dallia pectoralis TaxID=75939 RepID=A0ACC2FXP4_DALPE|nr:hypothetical protein DPEC_G00233750 [Dallia pectoralis]
MTTHFLSAKKGSGGSCKQYGQDDKFRLLPGENERNTAKQKKKDPSIKQKTKQTNMSKKRGYSSTPPNADVTEKPQTAPAHDTTIASSLPTQDLGDHQSKVKGQRCVRKSRKPKEKKTVSSLGSEKSTTSSFKATPAPSLEGFSSERSVQARESLRWEGVLEDPLEEERRLEVYRANRRQRYLLHRQEVNAVGGSSGNQRN